MQRLPKQTCKVKVPTLRNVDKRPSPGFVKAFMHNGYFKSLKTVVHFYNTRDAKPRCNDHMTGEADALRIGCWPAPEVEANLNKDEMGDLKAIQKVMGITIPVASGRAWEAMEPAKPAGRRGGKSGGKPGGKPGGTASKGKPANRRRRRRGPAGGAQKAA